MFGIICQVFSVLFKQEYAFIGVLGSSLVASLVQSSKSPQRALQLPRQQGSSVIVASLSLFANDIKCIHDNFDLLVKYDDELMCVLEQGFFIHLGFLLE